METLELGGKTYRVEALDAMSQFHVVRRIAPVMTAVGGSLAGLVPKEGEDDKAAFMMRVLTAAMDVVSKMSDADVDYVLFKCLSKASRKEGERYMRMATANQLQFADLSMPDMVRLSIEVMQVSGVFRFFQEQAGPEASASP